jgi:serine/threonine protein kinase
MAAIDRGETLGPGTRVGPYEIEHLLGEGGMGRVYCARGPDGEKVALKLVKENLGSDDSFRRRFDREARVAARLEHRHLVPVLDAGEHGGAPYMAQQFITGGSLEDRIERAGSLGLEESVRLSLQIAAGLDVLHGQGLVHRDLKPANILLDEEGDAHITDFGLAKDHAASVLTKPGQTVGSMDYMAPEQIRGQEVAATTDVYALGCVVCECLSGQAPFADREGMQILWAHLQEDPPDPAADREDVPNDVGWAILRALEKEPGQRPPTATAYARMVQVAAGMSPSGPGSSR